MTHDTAPGPFAGIVFDETALALSYCDEQSGDVIREEMPVSEGRFAGELLADRLLTIGPRACLVFPNPTPRNLDHYEATCRSILAILARLKIPAEGDDGRRLGRAGGQR